MPGVTASETRGRIFLVAVGTLFLVVFALPLFIAPFTWAEARISWSSCPADAGSTPSGR